MKIPFLLFSAVFFGVSTSQADDVGLSDVKGWLDGCVALAPTAGPMSYVLEFDCLMAAIKYCEVGRSIEYRYPCRSSLSSQLSSEISKVRPFLDPAEVKTALARKSFNRRVESLDSKSRQTCPEDLHETECELASIGTNWLEARALARAIGANFDQIVNDGTTDN